MERKARRIPLLGTHRRRASSSQLGSFGKGDGPVSVCCFLGSETDRGQDAASKATDPNSPNNQATHSLTTAEPSHLSPHTPQAQSGLSLCQRLCSTETPFLLSVDLNPASFKYTLQGLFPNSPVLPKPKLLPIGWSS